MNRLNEIGINNSEGGIMSSEVIEIAKEQKVKVEHIAKMNAWLDKKYNFRIINYSACGLKGDHEKAVKTLELVADTLQGYVAKNL